MSCPICESRGVGVAAAHDRRCSVAVRAFVTEELQLSTSALLYGAFAAVALPLLATRLLEADEPQARAGILAAAVAIAALPVVVMVRRVRRLRKAGYGRDDLVDALRADLSHRREELAFLYGEGRSPLERALRRLCYACVAAAGGVVLAMERLPGLAGMVGVRSEEHTSELQSRPHLVCRLLLEKKKKKKMRNWLMGKS